MNRSDAIEEVLATARRRWPAPKSKSLETGARRLRFLFSAHPHFAAVPGRAIIDFSGLDDGDRVVTAPELQRPDRVGSDDGGQRLVANAEPDLGQETVDAHFVDESPQAVPRAQPCQRLVVCGGCLAAARRRLLTCQQAINLRLSDPVVATLGRVPSAPCRCGPSV